MVNDFWIGDSDFSKFEIWNVFNSIYFGTSIGSSPRLPSGLNLINRHVTVELEIP